MLYVSRDAVTLMKIANYISFIAFVLHIFIGTESPKWLLLNGRIQESLDSLNWISKVNHLSFKNLSNEK
jgi:hypothetical protein